MPNTDDMIRLESPVFQRGSNRFKNEKPVLEISLSTYLIDRFPVTNAKYKIFIDAGGYTKKEYWIEQGWEFIRLRNIFQPNYWNDKNWNTPMQPVTGVSWWEAMAYASFAGKELPTEAQWEYAAGFGNRTYPWGEDEPTIHHANFAPGCEPSELDRRTINVDMLELNRTPSGCRDMAGNTGEWCLDNASSNYFWDKTRTDPIYLTREDEPHVIRGGSGLHDEDCLRCASRDHYIPGLRDNITGLRCVINLKRRQYYEDNRKI